MEWRQRKFLVSDDPNLINVDSVVRLLSGTYWAKDRSREIVLSTIQNSLCFGLYQDDDINRQDARQLGFARIISDRASMSWLCDLVIEEEHRSNGLGTWLLGCILEHPVVSKTTIYLRTTFAQSLYRQYGFEETECMRLKTSK